MSSPTSPLWRGLTPGVTHPPLSCPHPQHTYRAALTAINKNKVPATVVSVLHALKVLTHSLTHLLLTTLHFGQCCCYHPTLHMSKLRPRLLSRSLLTHLQLVSSKSELHTEPGSGSRAHNHTLLSPRHLCQQLELQMRPRGPGGGRMKRR